MSALHNTAHPSVGLERPPSRLPVLDDFNALCCLLVIMIHVMSLGITDADPTSWQGAVVFVPWLLSRCAVPGFLFSGGMKMGLELARDTLSPYGPYILRRAKKVYFPYLFWTLFYYLCFLPIGYVRGSLAELGNYLWFGSLSAQFYYVLVVMQLYLLRPLWRHLVRRVGCLAGCAGALVVMLAALWLQGAAAQAFPWFAPYQGKLFITYLFYWVAGLYAGYLRPERPAPTRRLWAILGSGLVVLTYLGLCYLEFSAGVVFFNLELMKPLSNLLSIYLLMELCAALKNCGPLLRRFLNWLYQASLFVFFVHCLVLTYATAILQKLGVHSLSLLLIGRLVASYLGSFLLYWLWNRLRQTIHPR